MPSKTEWTDEAYLLALPAEDDKFERKGTRLLDLKEGADENEVRNELTKQLSAFANSGGGRIVYGLNDSGVVDRGGISKILKGRQPTKDWLENVIPLLTEYEIVGVNISEVSPRDSDSTIAEGKALYVVDVPDSERAPHQSKRDHLYYVRLGGKSQPASHQIIEDIRNRAKHPDLDVLGFDLRGISFPRESFPRIAGALLFEINVRLKNAGPLKSTNTCLYVKCESPGSHFQDYDAHLVRPRRMEPNAVFWEIVDPIYPGMEIGFWMRVYAPIELLPAIRTLSGARWVSDTGGDFSDLSFPWTLFGDNAPAKHGQLKMSDLNFRDRIRELIDRDVARNDILRHSGGLP